MNNFFLKMNVCWIYGEFEISISSVSKISFLLGASSSGGADGSFGCSKPKQNFKKNLKICQDKINNYSCL